MIDQITLENFKSYKSATLKLAPLTLLIGANASGKSNAIEAIHLLSWLAHGRRLDDILHNMQQTDIDIRGTSHDLIYDWAEPDFLTLGCTLNNTKEWKNFSISIQIPSNGEDSELRVVAESINSETGQLPLYWIKEKLSTYSHEVQVAFNNFSRGGRKSTISCSDRQAIFTQLDIPSRFKSKSPKPRQIIPDVVQKLQKALQQILFLDPIPKHMTAYSFIVDDVLHGDGANTSSVLYNLCINQNKKENVLDFIRSLPEQDIVDIKFIITPRREVMVQLVESFGGREIIRDAPLLSDGTLRVLAIATAVLSAPEGSLLVIEEIDNGIHPSRAGMLLDEIQQIANDRNLRVLLTSHNPALLDTLPNTAIPHVVACYRNEDEGDSRLIRLEDLVDYPELIAEGPLGRLMTRGILDRYLKSQRSPEQKKQESLDWFESLQHKMEVV